MSLSLSLFHALVLAVGLGSEKLGATVREPSLNLNLVLCFNPLTKLDHLPRRLVLGF